MQNLILSKIKTYAILPPNRIIDSLYYFENFFNLKIVNFKLDNELDTSDLIIVDQTLLNQIKKIKDPKQYKFLVMLWNTDIDFQKFQGEIENIENSLKIKLNYFIIGTFYKRNSYFITTEKLKVKNNNHIKIKNLNFLLKIKFKLPYLFYVFFIIRNPLKFIKRIKKPKLYFFGYGKVSNDDLNEYIDINDKSNFGIFKKNVLEFLSKESDINKTFNFFSNLPSNKNFLMLQIHEKYYILQITFRHMFIICFEKYSNFVWAKTDYEFKSYQSPYFKKDYYLDFGSKITNCKNYSRYLFLKKFKKKTIYINFFDDFDGSVGEIEKKIKKSLIFLKKFNKEKKNFHSSCDELVKLININYHNF